jgi:hypothetical protein
MTTLNLPPARAATARRDHQDASCLRSGRRATVHRGLGRGGARSVLTTNRCGIRSAPWSSAISAGSSGPTSSRQACRRSPSSSDCGGRCCPAAVPPGDLTRRVSATSTRRSWMADGQRTGCAGDARAVSGRSHPSGRVVHEAPSHRRCRRRRTGPRRRRVRRRGDRAGPWPRRRSAGTTAGTTRRSCSG